MPDQKRAPRPLVTEDWLAVWLGFLILILVVLGLRPEIPRFRWATNHEFVTTALAEAPAVERLADDAQARGESSLAAAAGALRSRLTAGDRAGVATDARALTEAAKKAKDAGLRKRGEDLGRRVDGVAGADPAKCSTRTISGPRPSSGWDSSSFQPSAWR